MTEGPCADELINSFVRLSRLFVRVRLPVVMSATDYAFKKRIGK